MNLLDPQVLDVAVEIYTQLQREDLARRKASVKPEYAGYLESSHTSLLDNWERGLRSYPIFEPTHRCEEPLRCAVASLMRQYSKTLWDGHWFGERVKFLVPNCIDITNGFPQASGPAVAELIAEENGFEVVRELHSFFHQFDLYMEPDLVGVLPLVQTSKTEYWLRHEVEEVCHQKVKEVEAKGVAFTDRLMTEGFPSPTKYSCILCGELCHSQATFHSSLNGAAFDYWVHSGRCVAEVAKAVVHYRTSAIEAMQRLKQISKTKRGLKNESITEVSSRTVR